MKTILLTVLALFIVSCSPKTIIKNVPFETIKETIKEVIVQNIDTVIVKEFIACEPIPINTTVYFSFDSYELTPDAKLALDRIKDLPTGPLQVVGFTDIVGTDIYNYQLGLKRANTVYRYLRLGEPHIIVSKGEGECAGQSLYCRKVTITDE